MRLATLLFVFACTGTPKDDSGEPADTDTDTDADSDTDTDTDTDTDPRDAAIAGQVVLEDGSPATDLEVQVCAAVCRYLTTDADGQFSLGSLESARFKIDAMGELSGRDLGNALVGVDVGVSESVTLAASLVLPDMAPTVSVSETAGSDTYDLGQVQMTFAASDLDLPFGATDDDGNFALSAGVLEGIQIPLLWDVVPQVAVSFLPWLTEPGAPMSLTISDLSAADGTYQVYALEEYGEVTGPIGTATVAKGTATITDIQPTVWTWIFLVP